uniref:MazG nucleotide pyrophosphohydrolase n=1 Tax=Caldiarchaeum subterraneum TaxID=311458 RepID=E6N453_CALS0|nr:MazG nucleotide pyrophosphohydrolase [Candidatus Caldarchaeum subterraneum]BAJ48994.1 MazG nucleotide pyrophosphohydrolase [Candidatus Caldarchaeum subterraneum]
MRIGEAQQHLDRVYGKRDKARGLERTFLWLVSELGELSDAYIKNKGPRQLDEEAADVLAWLLSFCNVASIDLEKAFLNKYGGGCPRCGSIPCLCPLL